MSVRMLIHTDVKKEEEANVKDEAREEDHVFVDRDVIKLSAAE